MDVLGHKKEVELLKRIAFSKNIPHSILFSGPESVGKKRVALEFSKLINFRKNKEENDLISKEIDKRRYSDLVSIEKNEEIEIDEIRDLQQKISFKSRGPFKVAIIDNAELLNFEAQSSLLKTLEEPRGNIVIILITEYPNSLVKTILSRVWQLNFFEVKTASIEKYLIKKGLKEDQAKELALLSFSRPGIAVKLMEDKCFRKRFMERKKEFEFLQKADLSEKFRYIKKITEEKSEVKETLKYWSFFLRDKLKEGNGKKETIRIINSLETIQKNFLLLSKTNLSSKISLEKILINL